MLVKGRCLVSGTASARLLYSDEAISFWGGIDDKTGQILERNHPLFGKTVGGKVLAIPSGRGSCTGSAVMLELLLNGCAPAALILERLDETLTLGVLIAKTLFGASIPVLVISIDDFGKLQDQEFAAVSGDAIETSNEHLPLADEKVVLTATNLNIGLSSFDQAVLDGEYGLASRLAMQLVLDFAELQGASELLHVTQAHIDACIYIGPASLIFAEKFLSMSGRFAIPTTLNSISIDQRRWAELGMEPEMSAKAGALANAYVTMGAQSSFTCAPYSLETVPRLGDNAAWAESNAVVYLNSVLGGRTQKYPDFIDVCIALTGRAPLAGCHLDGGRLPVLQINVTRFSYFHDYTYTMLGYIAGQIAQFRIPLICGMELSTPTRADLKNFSAAFATTSSAAMFHIRGITPEGDKFQNVGAGLPQRDVSMRDLLSCWHLLNSACDQSVGLVSLGNPHFLLEEFERLSELCLNRHRHQNVDFIITTNRTIHEKAFQLGYIQTIEAFGAKIITDTCWCMLREPVIAKKVVNIMTNSAKYAHYGPGMVKKGFHFGGLMACVEAACIGKVLGSLGAIEA